MEEGLGEGGGSGKKTDTQDDRGKQVARDTG